MPYYDPMRPYAEPTPEPALQVGPIRKFWREEARPWLQTPLFGTEGNLPEVYSGFMSGLTSGIITPRVSDEDDDALQRVAKQSAHLFGLGVTLGAASAPSQVAGRSVAAFQAANKAIPAALRAKKIFTNPVVAATLYGLAGDTGLDAGTSEDASARLTNAAIFAGQMGIFHGISAVSKPAVTRMLVKAFPSFESNPFARELATRVVTNLGLGTSMGAVEAEPGERATGALVGGVSFALGALPMEAYSMRRLIKYPDLRKHFSDLGLSAGDSDSLTKMVLSSTAPKKTYRNLLKSVVPQIHLDRWLQSRDAFNRPRQTLEEFVETLPQGEKGKIAVAASDKISKLDEVNRGLDDVQKKLKGNQNMDLLLANMRKEANGDLEKLEILAKQWRADGDWGRAVENAALGKASPTERKINEFLNELSSAYREIEIREAKRDKKITKTTDDVIKELKGEQPKGKLEKIAKAEEVKRLKKEVARLEAISKKVLNKKELSNDDIQLLRSKELVNEDGTVRAKSRDKEAVVSVNKVFEPVGQYATRELAEKAAMKGGLEVREVEVMAPSGTAVVPGVKGATGELAGRTKKTAIRQVRYEVGRWVEKTVPLEKPKREVRTTPEQRLNMKQDREIIDSQQELAENQLYNEMRRDIYKGDYVKAGAKARAAIEASNKEMMDLGIVGKKKGFSGGVRPYLIVTEKDGMGFPIIADITEARRVAAANKGIIVALNTEAVMEGLIDRTKLNIAVTAPTLGDFRDLPEASRIQSKIYSTRRPSEMIPLHMIDDIVFIEGKVDPQARLAFQRRIIKSYNAEKTNLQEEIIDGRAVLSKTKTEIKPINMYEVKYAKVGESTYTAADWEKAQVLENHLKGLTIQSQDKWKGIQSQLNPEQNYRRSIEWYTQCMRYAGQNPDWTVGEIFDRHFKSTQPDLDAATSLRVLKDTLPFIGSFDLNTRVGSLKARVNPLVSTGVGEIISTEPQYKVSGLKEQVKHIRAGRASEIELSNIADLVNKAMAKRIKSGPDMKVDLGGVPDDSPMGLLMRMVGKSNTDLLAAMRYIYSKNPDVLNGIEYKEPFLKAETELVKQALDFANGIHTKTVELQRNGEFGEAQRQGLKNILIAEMAKIERKLQELHPSREADQFGTEHLVGLGNIPSSYEGLIARFNQRISDSKSRWEQVNSYKQLYDLLKGGRKVQFTAGEGKERRVIAESGLYSGKLDPHKAQAISIPRGEKWLPSTKALENTYNSLTRTNEYLRNTLDRIKLANLQEKAPELWQEMVRKDFSELTREHSRVNPDNPTSIVMKGLAKALDQPRAGKLGVKAATIDYLKRNDLTYKEIGTPIRVDHDGVKIIDSRTGSEVTLKKGTEYTPIRLTDGSILIHDGKDLIVQPTEYRSLEELSHVLGAGKQVNLYDNPYAWLNVGMVSKGLNELVHDPAIKKPIPMFLKTVLQQRGYMSVPDVVKELWRMGERPKAYGKRIAMDDSKMFRAEREKIYKNLNIPQSEWRNWDDMMAWALNEVRPVDPNNLGMWIKTDLGQKNNAAHWNQLPPELKAFTMRTASYFNQWLDVMIDRGLLPESAREYARKNGWFHVIHETREGEMFGSKELQLKRGLSYKRRTWEESIKLAEEQSSRIRTNIGDVVEHYANMAGNRIAADTIMRGLEHFQGNEKGFPVVAYGGKDYGFPEGFTNKDFNNYYESYTDSIAGRANGEKAYVLREWKPWIENMISSHKPGSKIAPPPGYARFKTGHKLWTLMNPAWMAINAWNYNFPIAGPVSTLKAMLGKMGFADHVDYDANRMYWAKEGLPINLLKTYERGLFDSMYADMNTSEWRNSKIGKLLQKSVYDQWGLRKFMFDALERASVNSANILEAKYMREHPNATRAEAARATVNFAKVAAAGMPDSTHFSGFTGSFWNWVLMSRNSMVSNWLDQLGLASAIGRRVPGQAGKYLSELARTPKGPVRQLLRHYGYASEREFNWAMDNYARQLLMQLAGYGMTTALVSKAISGIFPWEREDKSKLFAMNTGILDANGSEVMITPPFFKDVRDMVTLLNMTPGSNMGPRTWVINKADPTLKGLLEVVTNHQFFPWGAEQIITPGMTLPERIGTLTGKYVVGATPLAKPLLPIDMVNQFSELYPKTKAEQFLNVVGLRTTRSQGGVDTGRSSLAAYATRTKQAEKIQQAKYQRLTDEMDRAWIKGDRAAAIRLMRLRAKSPEGFEQAYRLWMEKRTRPREYWRTRASRLTGDLQQQYAL